MSGLDNGTITASLLPPEAQMTVGSQGKSESESIFGTGTLDGAVRIHRGSGRF